MRPLGLRAQLTAGIVITTLAGIGLIGLLAIKIVETGSIYWKVNEARSLVRTINTIAQMSSSDPSEGLRYAAVVLSSSGITDYRITGPAGKPLMRGGAVPAEEGAALPSNDGLKVSRIGGGWFWGGGRAEAEVLKVSAPYGKEATFEFAVPLHDIKESMAGIKRFLLFYAVIDSVIIIALGIYILSRSIINPIKRLDEAATRIAGGKLFERAEVAVDNEIGSLAASFNTMAERLEAEIKSLERVNVELMTAQEELLRSSTLAAVGRLAAGIAHEIGNPLGAVSGYIDILSKGMAEGEEEREILARTVKELERIDDIVREFLELSRPSKKAASSVDVGSVLREAIEAAAARKDFEGVSTALNLSDGLPPVMIDEGKLRQVFINLLLNAAHAMEGLKDRAITVDAGVETHPLETMRRRKDDPPLTGAPEREFVFVRFTDNGRGISEEDAKRIFDPFFTTKGVGKGTGLGLFVSLSIIKAYGGSIALSTTPGEGSAFKVLLPSGKGI